MQAEWFRTEVFSLKDLLYRLALRWLNDNEEAEDAVQQVMMQMWQKKESLAHINPLRPFIIKALQNDCFNRLKKEQIVARHHLQIGKMQKHFLTDSQGNMVEIIKKEISKLPEKQRLIIHLCDVEGFDAKEIASIVDIDEVAVRVNLSRARKKVKNQIQKIKAYEERKL